MLWIGFAMPTKVIAQNYFAVAVVLLMATWAAAADWINRNRP